MARKPLPLRWVVAIVCLDLVAVSQSSGEEAPVEACTVAVLNRTASVRADGTWEIPNVPVGFGRVRFRLTCVKDGITRGGQGDFVSLTANVVNGISTIPIAEIEPVPVRITLSASPTTIEGEGSSVQLRCTGFYSDESTRDLTSSSSGTGYLSSNPRVAIATDEGLVSAVASGSVLISAANEGVLASVRIQVLIGGDQDRDGLPDDFERANGLDPNDPTDAFGDEDADSLSNLEEFQAGTAVRNPDTDSDGQSDFEETVSGEDGFVTNPLNRDSDLDGVGDRLEVLTGSDPTDANSVNLADALERIRIVPEDFVLVVNTVIGEASRQLAVSGLLKDGFTIDLTARGTNYSSSDLGVINFGGRAGEVFAGADGIATVTATNSGHTSIAHGTVRSFAPVALSSLEIPGFANNVEVSDRFAYVAAGSAGLVVVDWSDVEAPLIVSVLDTPGNANDVRVRGSLAFVADGDAGLDVVDVSVPTAPRRLGSLPTPGIAHDLAVLSSHVLVADGAFGVQVVSVSDPFAPTAVGALDTPGTAKGVAAEGIVAVVADGPGGVHVLDVTDPATPRLAGSLGGFSDARDVAFEGGVAFVADFTEPGGNSLKVVEVGTGQAAPVLAGSTGAGNFILQDVELADGLAFGADVLRLNGVPIVDVSVASQPLLRSVLDFSVAFQDSDGTGIAVTRSHVLLTAATGIFENGSDGSTRLYIGQYRKEDDTLGVAPTARIASSQPGEVVIEETTLRVVVDAADDVEIASVRLFLDGEVFAGRLFPPYEFDLTVPVGVTSMVFGAKATDFGGNVGVASKVAVQVIPDPKTTVAGRVVDETGPGVAGVTVTVLDAFTDVTGVDGFFSIPDVPTIRGELVARARASRSVANVTVNLAGESAAFPPVRAGVTEVGNVVVRIEPVVVLDPDALYADGLQSASVIVVTAETRVGLRANLGSIEGGEASAELPGLRLFDVLDNVVTATYRSPSLALQPGETADDAVEVFTLDAEGARSLLSASVRLAGKNSSVVTVDPSRLFADGIQTSTLLVTGIRDSNGNAVPDGTECLLVASLLETGFAPDPNAGSVLGGSESACSPLGRIFSVTGAQIAASYRSPSAPVAPGASVQIFIQLWSVDPATRCPLGLTGRAEMILIGKNSSAVVVSPDRVFANPSSTATVLVTSLRDLDGNAVPDGTKCIVAAGFEETAFSPNALAGAIEGGSPNPSLGSSGPIFTVSGAQIVATYRAPDLPLGPGTTFPVFVQAWSVDEDGIPVGLTGTGRVTLIGKNASTISVTPSELEANAARTADVVVTSIRDLDGNPVPDGTKCIVLATFSADLFLPDPLAGTIEGGSPNPHSALGALAPLFTVSQGQILATYRTPNLNLASGQSVTAFVQVWSSDGAGTPGGLTGSARVTLTGPQTSQVVITPSTLFASSDQTASVVVSNIVDMNGLPLPDGTLCIVVPSFFDGQFFPDPNAGVIEGGVASACYFGGTVRMFAVTQGRIEAVYRAPTLPLAPGSVVTVFIQVWSVDGGGCVSALKSRGHLTLFK